VSARELARRSTVDALAEALRARILEGEPEPGTPLREEALAREYDVARHSLRSALRALEAEGIVRIEPHRGARVTALSADDVRGLSTLRTALEVEGARLALAAGGGRLPAAGEGARGSRAPGVALPLRAPVVGSRGGGTRAFPPRDRAGRGQPASRGRARSRRTS
jgi:DNA-binding transcriptional regulator YhcF (GntR family)